MLLLSLAARSLRNRLLSTGLTVFSIALSVALLVGIENVRVGMRESFSHTISRTDLIVGARGGTIQLLLYSVFGMGSPTNNIDHATYERLSHHPAVAWTIPYALGDSHHGFRVIGTTDDFYAHYRFRENRKVEFAEGRSAGAPNEVVLGAEVARRLGYRVGQPITVTHGIGATGFIAHDENPFHVVGVLRETFTPVDRALYVTLEGVSAMHAGMQAEAAGGFAPPSGMPDFAAPVGPATAPAAEAAGAHAEPAALEPTQVTAVFVGAKSRIDALRLQREIGTDAAEPLTAVIPGMALAEMWRGIGYAEGALRLVTLFVVLVGLLGMLLSLYTSLDARRREMAILRAVGAGPRRIVGLLVLESGLLAMLGSAIGVGLVYLLLFALQVPVEQRFGLFLAIRPLGAVEYAYLGAVVGAGVLLGLVPALRAYRNALVDGLSVRG